MRILIVTPYPLFPTSHGGRARVWGIARALRVGGATVDIVCPWTPAFSLQSFVRSGVTIHPHILPVNLLPLVVSARLAPPLVMLSWQPFDLGPRQLLARFRGYDIAQFHFCANADWMGREPAGAKVVYVAHNVERDYQQHAPPTMLASARAARALARLEARTVAASDLIVTCTAADAERLRALDGTTTPMVVIPQASDLLADTGADTRVRIRRQLGIADDELVIAFVGGPAYHNRRALHSLERMVMSRLRRPARLLAIGGASMHGHSPQEAHRTLRLGYVENIAPLLAAADVGVNPSTASSGSNCKIALYLAAGLPVLTTPVGVRGYEDRASECTIAEVDEFAARLAGMPIREQAHVRPPAVWDWKIAGDTLLSAYETLLAARR